jgi:beta-1,4-mannosyl-glycoprotein beta-1,4-N-acetylglucosaminyltransferase
MKNLNQLSIRKKPRRVIMGIIVNHELNLTEVRFNELASEVDIFVVMESSITSGGDVKPLYFLNEFKENGFLAEYHSKILYLQLESIPQSYITDGWLAEAYLRNYMSVNALNLIKGNNPGNQ